MTVNPIPAGCNSVNAYLIVKDGQAALDFYAEAFGAVGGMCMTMPDGSMMHAEFRIGNSTVMLSPENPQWGNVSAATLGGSPISLHLYVEDADATFQRAVDAGCKVTAPMMDAFWGDRYGKVEDPFGIQWGIATHKEDLTPEQLSERQQEWLQQMAGGDS